jgi:hypothetical protein
VAILTRSDEAVATGVQFVFREGGHVLLALEMDTTYWAALGRPDEVRIEMYVRTPAVVG